MKAFLEHFKKVEVDEEEISHLILNKDKFLATPVDPATVFTRFGFVRALGEGAEGVVVLLLDLNTFYPVVAKVVKVDYSRESDIESYIRKIQASGLPFPQFFTTFPLYGYIIILEEFIPGQTLGEWVERQRLLPPPIPGKGYAVSFPDNYWYQVYEILTQLIAGLLLLIRFNIVHDDLHAHNLIWTDQHKLYIIDFGLACIKRDDAPPKVRCLPVKNYNADVASVRTIGEWLLPPVIDTPLYRSLRAIPSKLDEIVSARLDQPALVRELRQLLNNIGFLLSEYPDLYAYVTK